jgi:hypothetical protein
MSRGLFQALYHIATATGTRPLVPGPDGEFSFDPPSSIWG